MAHAAWKWMVVAAGVGAAVLACSGDGDGDGGKPPPPVNAFDAGVNEVRPGLGNDPGEPQGTPFSLPPGVTVSGNVYGAANDSTSDCGNGAPGNGSGVYVRVCVPLRNATGAPVEVVFPPGLIIITAAEGFQHGLLVERVVVRVPPTRGGPGGQLPDGGTDPDAVVVPLFTYCLNESKDPSDTGIPYTIGPVTSDSALRELLDLLANKRIDTAEDVDVVQDAIYSITERKGLTMDDRNAINKL